MRLYWPVCLRTQFQSVMCMFGKMDDSVVPLWLLLLLLLLLFVCICNHSRNAIFLAFYRNTQGERFLFLIISALALRFANVLTLLVVFILCFVACITLTESTNSSILDVDDDDDDFMCWSVGRRLVLMFSPRKECFRSSFRISVRYMYLNIYI